MIQPDLATVVRHLTNPATTIRVQPVEPEKPTSEERGREFVAAAGLLLLGGLFVCLGTLAAHQYWPQIPPVGYWQALAMLLGLSAVRLVLGSRPFKWARR